MGSDMAVIEDVRPLGAELERSYQVYVRGRLKFRVKQIVYVAFSLDESVMGFAFPKEEREALVLSEPHKFQMPTASDMRFNWVHADLAALDPTEARELVVDAWRMVVPKKLSDAYDFHPSHRPGLRPCRRDDFRRIGRVDRRLRTVGPETAGDRAVGQNGHRHEVLGQRLLRRQRLHFVTGQPVARRGRAVVADCAPLGRSGRQALTCAAALASADGISNQRSARPGRDI
jgi:hypothetical protein